MSGPRMGQYHPAATLGGWVREGVIAETEKHLREELEKIIARALVGRFEVQIDSSDFGLVQEGPDLISRSVVTLRMKGFGR